MSHKSISLIHFNFYYNYLVELSNEFLSENFAGFQLSKPILFLNSFKLSSYPVILKRIFDLTASENKI
jgi:hypothetical protein